MCQVFANSSDGNPFTDDASRLASKKRPRSEDKQLAAAPTVGSPVSVDGMHYNLRIKRVRSPASFSHASPCPTAAKVKTRPAATAVAAVSVSRDLNAEVKTLQRKVGQMQEQVKEAVDGIRQLRQLIGVLAMQRHRAAVLARSSSTDATAVES